MKETGWKSSVLPLTVVVAILVGIFPDVKIRLSIETIILKRVGFSGLDQSSSFFGLQYVLLI